MIITNNIAAYALLAIVTFGKKSFENIGRAIKKSGDTISRMLHPGHASITQSQKLAQWITAVRRINKHGEESIVFQAATYKAILKQHAQNYKHRWPIEKLFRTTKQYLGLQECFSRKIEVQYNHICAVLLAYAITQLEMKKKNYSNPEEAIRAFKKKKQPFLNHNIKAIDHNIDPTYA